MVEHRDEWQQRTLQSLFEEDATRARDFFIDACGLRLDYSKNHITERTVKLLTGIAAEAKLPSAIAAMFSGEKINQTEGRKVLHVALRSQQTNSEEEKAVHATLAKIEQFIEQIYSGEWRGFTNHAISDVVNIGIGGSDLGPRMATHALSPYHQQKVNVHFVANIDGADLWHCLRHLQPQSTLFIVASKSFTTLETLENALSARSWLLQHGCAERDIGKHFVAISSNIDKAVAFGIDADNIFPMWDWVGGRYSLWSAIGLPIALAIGMENFKALLQGAAAMDQHFRNTEDYADNMPVMLALLTFWYGQCWGAQSQAILPYYHFLKDFPAYLQQLDMESLGKDVNRDGEVVDYPTGLVIWGSEGTNGQHSFYQLLHQGKRMVPVDFIATRKAHHPLLHQQQHLYACCLSQSQALMVGKSLEHAESECLQAGMSQEQAKQLAPHKRVPGNRPSNTLVTDELSPYSLGALIALYEHKVFVMSVLLNINAFDQWGVELGKQLSGPLFQALAGGNKHADWDSSTQGLVDYFNDDH